MSKLSSKDIATVMVQVEKLLNECKPENTKRDAIAYARQQLSQLKVKKGSKIDHKKLVKKLDLPRKLTEEELDDILSFRLWINMECEPAKACVETAQATLKKDLVNMWFYPENIPKLKKYIHTKYSLAQVQAGEMVGVLVAQAVGEPSTQLTLRTFHQAGIGNAYVNTGIGRILSLLAISKNDNSARIFFNEDLQPEQLYKHIQNIKAIRIKNLIDTADPDKTPLRVVERTEDPWWYCRGDPLPDGDFSHYILLKFSLPLLYRYGITMQQIDDILSSKYSKIPNDSKLIVKRSPDAMAEMHIFLESFKFEKERDLLFVNDAVHVNEANITYYFMRDKLADIIKNILISGIDEIEEVSVSKVSSSDTTTWVLDTKGCNLQRLFANTDINYRKTMSSSVLDNFNILGIEASRAHLVHEFKYLFDANGVSVAIEDIETLASSMTWTGRPMSVSRYSMTSGGNVIQQASFEKSDESFINAAFNAATDNCKGVSASILVGKPMEGGTGLPEIVLDKKKEAQFFKQACEMLGVDSADQINSKLALLCKNIRGDTVDIIEYEE